MQTQVEPDEPTIFDGPLNPVTLDDLAKNHGDLRVVNCSVCRKLLVAKIDREIWHKATAGSLVGRMELIAARTADEDRRPLCAKCLRDNSPAQKQEYSR